MNILTEARQPELDSEPGERLSPAKWQEMAALAWRARENSFLIGKTKVGAAVLTSDGLIFAGCNVEHRYRCHDVHAEVNAITSMVTAGQRALTAIIVVAQRDRFTPCGGCADWIFQFGGPSCLVGFQNQVDGPVRVWTAHELMPHYPE